MAQKNQIDGCSGETTPPLPARYVKREVRVRQLPKSFDGKVWHTEPQEIVRLGDVGAWSMCRVAGYRDSAPFVMSRKEWDKLPLSAQVTKPLPDSTARLILLIGGKRRDSAMARKQPKIPHLKFVRRNGREYCYFNTGIKVDGKIVRVPCRHPSQPGFGEQYGALCAGRTKRAQPTYTVPDLATDYLRSKDFAAKAENTQRLYMCHLAIVQELWADTPANELESQDVREAIEARQWGSGTHNMMLAVIGVIYTWGRRHKRLKAEPTKDVERLTSGKHDAWPDDVLEAALQDEALRLPVHLMAFTGLRIGDALSLRWGQIKGGVITITPQKTKRYNKTLHIPLAAELAEELDRAPRKGLTVLHGLVERRLRQDMAAFGAKHGAHIVPHGLRTNAVEGLLHAGCSVAETAAITGQTYQIVEHYAAKISTRHLAKAAIVKLDANRRKSV